ncbi:MAG: phospho-sugar mutase [Acutalibacteraceae bacterium]
MTEYEYWLTFDEQTKNELESITDKAELDDRFYKNLEFGTGGLRGIMGAGPNRMNIYTVSKATKGLADYLNNTVKGEKSVAVAYDSRNNSAEFARAASGVLCKAGIKVFLFETLMPTPVLSFAVRYHSCCAGIVITASHNPKEYNGYKVYDSKGCQLVPKYADEVIKYVNAVEDIGNIPCESPDSAEKEGKLVRIGEETLNAFLAEVKKQSVYSEKSDLKIVYTPLHGTGRIPVTRILADKNVSVVREQEMPDGDFSTVRSPNPEEKDALTLALSQAERENADIVIGTDPDCDRVGVGVRHNGGYVLLTGNQTGALLVDFVLKFKKDSLSENAAVVKTIVTSGLGSAIAEKYGVKTVQTLTGFKYIGEKICLWEDNGEHTFIFGYEESYGYLAGTHARDKDAVSASMLIAEMAAYYKNQGMTLVDALNGIYSEFGYYYDCLETFVLKGREGAEKIRSAMEALRNGGAKLIDGVESVEDYSKGIGDLPKENVLRFVFGDGSWFAVRPSGTEPKLKIYFSVRGENREKSEKRKHAIQSKLTELIF